MTEKARCIPPNPERDGYWWVRRWNVPAPAIPLAWTATWHANAQNGWGQFSQPDREDQWEILGPVASLDDSRRSDVLLDEGRQVIDAQRGRLARLAMYAQALVDAIIEADFGIVTPDSRIDATLAELRQELGR